MSIIKQSVNIVPKFLCHFASLKLPYLPGSSNCRQPDFTPGNFLIFPAAFSLIHSLFPIAATTGTWRYSRPEKILHLFAPRQGCDFSSLFSLLYKHQFLWTSPNSKRNEDMLNCVRVETSLQYWNIIIMIIHFRTNILFSNVFLLKWHVQSI